jgi:hypothetical protein
VVEVNVGGRRLVIGDFIETGDGEQAKPFVFARQPDSFAVAARFPGAKGFGFVVVGFHRPIPGHVDDFGHQAQPPVCPVSQPKAWVAGLGVGFPGEAFGWPQAVVVITAGFDEAQEFTIGNQMAAGLEGGNR